jgi:gamma-glutamyltranspeptidase / glutathione hydrolase
MSIWGGTHDEWYFNGQPVNSLDLTCYPYSSTRRVVLSQRGAVATSQPLAAMAGMEMLVAGGNG